MNDLNELMANLPGFSLITAGMKTSALQAGRIPDANGVWPGAVGYADTYDVYYAAWSLVPFLMAQPVVTATSSEGTSVTATGPNWGALRESYQLLSVVLSGSVDDVLRVITIPATPYLRKLPMNDKGGYFGDVDTDLG